LAAPLRLCHRRGEPPHAVSGTRGKRGLGLLKKRIRFFARKHDPLGEPGSPTSDAVNTPFKKYRNTLAHRQLDRGTVWSGDFSDDPVHRLLPRESRGALRPWSERPLQRKLSGRIIPIRQAPNKKSLYRQTPTVHQLFVRWLSSD
jgi:hypothetical protein